MKCIRNYHAAFDILMGRISILLLLGLFYLKLSLAFNAGSAFGSPKVDTYFS
jgi:hypothetical protein